METVRVRKWTGKNHASEEDLRGLLTEEHLVGYTWSNSGGDTYEQHEHDYHKVIYVVTGSITFHLPATGEDILLNPGDRLELPAATVHSAIVGSRGVTCLEAHKAPAGR